MQKVEQERDSALGEVDEAGKHLDATFAEMEALKQEKSAVEQELQELKSSASPLPFLPRMRGHSSVLADLLARTCRAGDGSARWPHLRLACGEGNDGASVSAARRQGVVACTVLLEWLTTA